MSDATVILHDLVGRIRDEAASVCDGLAEEHARYQVNPGTNTICWLLWHTAREIDSQIHQALGGPQLWDEWADRLGLSLPPARLGSGATGYGQNPDDVIYVVAPVDDLLEYLTETCDETDALIDGLGVDDLGRIIDAAWNPPVTLSVRLVSILADALQHIGQAALVRGVAERATAE
ncbi:DUF664 domain-containing protein [Acidipropionibacterium virtanenii]|uniref:DinB-like domain-containing protein n=1 Tax=Acidipropionibacterium virtanenii TaxID=2057246 RepID=A0A344US70_9ACTN|nr:DUF664 domain-containing protein [Acidipropionibacterium virtanenii]AXE38118.1 hypothetical protein JS278_00935 [Acidipropionibacterium virtanenii]